MSAKDKSRAGDEVALRAIDLMKRGYSSEEIGQMFGRGVSFARVLRNRIMAADIAESGEPEHIVRAAYKGRAHG